MQRALRRHIRIELAQTACRRIAWIGESGFALLHLPLVERGKIALGHINFTAHFADLWHVPMQLVRDFLDRAHIGGDIFTFKTIAAGSGLHQLADRVSASDAQDDFAATVEAIQDWLDLQVRSEAAAGAGPASLAPYAQVWEKVADSVREAEAINLDKRPLILSIFADLAAAVSAARP
jgi:hypothetical protein